MAKVFDFQMPVIYVMFKLIIRVQRLIFNSLHIYKVGLTKFVVKLENLSIHQLFN